MNVYFKENLAYLRKKLNKTQSDVALQVNKSQRIISNWERDNTEPSLEEIGILSDFFGVTSDDLLFKNLEIDSPDSKKEVGQSLSSELLSLKKTIESQESTIAILSNSVEDKNSIISLLKSENERLKRAIQDHN